MCQDGHPDIAGVYHFSLGCANSTPATHLDHFYKPLPPNNKYHIGYLHQLVTEGAPEQTSEVCGVVEGTSCRRPTCGVDHP